MYQLFSYKNRNNKKLYFFYHVENNTATASSENIYNILNKTYYSENDLPKKHLNSVLLLEFLEKPTLQYIIKHYPELLI